MTLRAAIRALLELRRGLAADRRPGAWQVRRSPISGNYVVVAVAMVGEQPELEISETSLAENEAIAAAEGVDLVEYLAGCAE